MSATVRPCDRAHATILAFQDELTELGLLTRADGTTGRAVPCCGTEAGASRHRRRREPVCADCLRAEGDAHRAREAANAGHVRERDRARLQRWRAKQAKTEDQARAARLVAAEASAEEHARRTA